ncbi:DUF4190 domain-containing protein [Streptacidiphilus melanogenes]|uniref:DUF4190 domain-containing protein n=1 Tax=Streptacidiphilus melanogenes TaxID=411235 RepID=UPI0005A75786|nr:DUF4190 domain-containing protein [Streptacidiphilus melanogenes]
MTQPYVPDMAQQANRPVCVAAVVSAVASLFGLPGAIVGAVSGVVALRQIAREGMRGKALAWTGIAISGLWVIASGLAVIVLLAASGHTVSGSVVVHP